jgi:hypothetical protein
MKMLYGGKYSVLWTYCCVKAVKITAGFRNTAASSLREAKKFLLIFGNKIPFQDVVCWG